MGDIPDQPLAGPRHPLEPVTYLDPRVLLSDSGEPEHISPDELSGGGGGSLEEDGHPSTNGRHDETPVDLRLPSVIGSIFPVLFADTCAMPLNDSEY